MFNSFSILNHTLHPTFDFSLSCSGCFYVESHSSLLAASNLHYEHAFLISLLLIASSEPTGRAGQKCRGLMPGEDNAPPRAGRYIDERWKAFCELLRSPGERELLWTIAVTLILCTCIGLSCFPVLLSLLHSIISLISY